MPGKPAPRKQLKRRLRLMTMTIAGVAAAMGAGAAMFVIWGVYNVSALQQHTEWVYLALDTALNRSISRRAEELSAPPLGDEALIRQGFLHYRQTCVRCHGAPGVARDDIAKGMTPMPSNLVDAARKRTAEEIFWTVKHGIKMTGMPAWQFEYTDAQTWSIVAFVMHMPRLTPARYRAMDLQAGRPEPVAGRRRSLNDYPAPGTGDPERGRLAMHSYACVTCHVIPGVVGPEANVGPPLTGIAGRRYIGGVLTNTFGNMVRWIEDPVAVDPLTAMPDMGVARQDAIDIAAYLYSLEGNGRLDGE